MTTKPLHLPEVSPEELSMARAYLDSILGDAEAPEGDDLIHLIARYGWLRQNQESYLRNLAGNMKAQEDPNAGAVREFMGKVCPVCSQPKDPTFWFCRDCWTLVSKEAKELRDRLWHRIADADHLRYYRQARGWLRQKRGVQA